MPTRVRSLGRRTFFCIGLLLTSGQFASKLPRIPGFAVRDILEFQDSQAFPRSRRSLPLRRPLAIRIHPPHLFVLWHFPSMRTLAREGFCVELGGRPDNDLGLC